jgi:hypothetical protein
MPDDDIATDIIDLLFRQDEEPIFIHETASIEGSPVTALSSSAVLHNTSEWPSGKNTLA